MKKKAGSYFSLWRKPKILLIMKLSAILMVVFTLNLSATGFAQFSFTSEVKKVREVLDIIEKESNYRFFYNDEFEFVDKVIDLKFSNQNINQVLDKLLASSDYTYKIFENNLIVFSLKDGICEQSDFQQNIVKGTVTDEQGNSLTGVTIVVKGTTRGTLSDVNGNYIIEVEDPKSILVFSFIGYATQEISLNGRTSINLVLEGAVESLEEVIVIGYGTQKKVSVTAAISSMTVEKLTSIPTTDLSRTLGGRLAGVIIKEGTGEPGRDYANIYIRGISTIGNKEPLVIVDGIPRAFETLDVNSIESFTVLKDAAAAAPYGVAGANGVILVTTKRGKTGAPTITYNGYVGFQNSTVLPDYCNGYEYALLRNAAAENVGLPIPYSEDALQAFLDGSDPDRYPPLTDVYDVLINKNAPITQHSLTMSGGTEIVKYHIGLGYRDQQAIWPGSVKRYNLITNIDVQATKTTTVSLNLNGILKNIRSPYADWFKAYTRGPDGLESIELAASRLFELIGYVSPSIGPLLFSNGMPGEYIYDAWFKGGYYKNNSNTIYTQLSIEQVLPFIPGLTVKGTMAYDPKSQKLKRWRLPHSMAGLDVSKTPYVITPGIYGPVLPQLYQDLYDYQQITYQASLNYRKTFGKSTIAGLTIFEVRTNEDQHLGASRVNYNLYIDEISMGSSVLADIKNSGESYSARQMGLVYRVNYEYAGKYLFEASGRYDGHYYFAPGNKFGFFPAFSVGWRLSEEDFIKGKLPWINNMKIRGSYGEVGALAGSPFQYLTTYSVVTSTYAFGGQGLQGLRERAQPNYEITWERSKKTDVGFDLTLWNGLLSIESDYFYEKRSNMLVNPDVIVPAEYGIGLSQLNAGVMQNQGVEFSLGSHYEFSKDFRVSLESNFTFAKNKLLEIFESQVTYDNPNRRLTGKPLGTQFGYKSLGYFQLDDFEEDGTLKDGIAVQPWGVVKPGDIRYEDITPDGKINTDDLTVIGDPVSAPRIVYGFSPTINYKGLQLNLLFQGVAKVNLYIADGGAWPFWNGMNALTKNFDYWTPENPNATYPRIEPAQSLNNKQVSSHWIHDASYLRLKNIALSYSIPLTIIDRIKIQSCQVYVSGQNLLTWTDLVDLDPEFIPGLGRGWSPNSGWGYPQQKIICIGINLTL